jgi:hypothetical protein
VRERRRAVDRRRHVVHEAGLFQGRLGFERAIILLEDGCKSFDQLVDQFAVVGRLIGPGVAGVICFAHLSLPAGSAIAGRLGALARQV